MWPSKRRQQAELSGRASGHAGAFLSPAKGVRLALRPPWGLWKGSQVLLGGH